MTIETKWNLDAELRRRLPRIVSFYMGLNILRIRNWIYWIFIEILSRRFIRLNWVYVVLGTLYMGSTITKDPKKNSARYLIDRIDFTQLEVIVETSSWRLARIEIVLFIELPLQWSAVFSSNSLRDCVRDDTSLRHTRN